MKRVRLAVPAATLAASIAFSACHVVRTVPTVQVPPGNLPLLCAPAALLPFRLRVDLAGTPPVWGEWEADGTRFEIVWPPRFTARGDAVPVLVDHDGRVVARDGELITDAGGSGSDPATICTLKGKEYRLS